MGTLKLNTTSGGSVSIQAADGASDNTVTLPAVSGANIITSADSGTITQGMIGSGVAGSGPSFSAVQSSSTTLTINSYTKILFATEEWDLTSDYDTSTSKFTPSVAGYYQVNAAWVAASSFAFGSATIYKNGSRHRDGQSTGYSSSSSNGWTVSALIYMNGSTDYLEVYAYTSPGNTTSTGSHQTYFQAALVRAA